MLGDGLVVVLPPATAPSTRPRRPGLWMHNGGAWVHVGAGALVTAFSGKVDMGQDNRTGLALLVAEELRVPLASVRMVMGDTDVAPFDMGTFGSRSTPDAGEDLRIAAASAREHLLRIAAQAWHCDAAALEAAADGAVRERGDASHSAPYAELVRGLRRVEQAMPDAPVTPESQWRTAGGHGAAAAARIDIVTGARRYVSDLVRPGMLHGVVLRPPVPGARLRSVDTRAAEAMDGVTVVRETDLVAVVAPRESLAHRAMAQVRAEWDTPALPSSDGIVDHLRAHPLESHGWEGALHQEGGDVEAALRAAATTLETTYTTAYIAHAPLETRAALAEWDPAGRLTVHVGTQVPFGVRAGLADALDLAEGEIRVVVPPTGGAFGGKHAADVALEAARLARTTGRPVRVHWTREEEFRHAYLRPAAVIDVRSGLDAAGRLVAWDFRNLNSGPQSIACPYRVANLRLDFQPADSPLPQGSYRALAATANSFARESHVDELAHGLGEDPLAFRLRHLDDPRLADVLRAAAERIGWDSRPRQVGGTGFGIAASIEKDAYVATAATVRVGDGGPVQVTRLVTAFDCGAVVNPDGLRRQVEGATVMGLGGALFEAVEVEAGRITNAGFLHYRVPRFADVPPIDTVLLDRRDIPSAGGGETPIIAVAPALANALFVATGERRRSLPLAAEA